MLEVGKKRCSRLDLSRNQHQQSDEEEEEDQSSADDDENQPQQHAQQGFHGRFQAKSTETIQEKWPNNKQSFLISPSSANLATKQLCQTRPGEKMQMGFHKQSPTLKLKNTRGEIVEVHGGRILRSTGRKDRHSKVSTAKGPRDRRVRLSANTAIQFYDVQDRLGYNRPSEAIDWLMKEARAAIEALDQELPEQAEVEEHNNQGEFPNSGHEKQQFDGEEPINSFSFFVPSTSFQNLPSESTTFFSASATSNSLNFETSPTNWPNNPHIMEIGQFQRMLTWNNSSNSSVVGQDQLFSQGGTLQSSFSPSFPALSELNYGQNPSPVTGNSFPGDGFLGFCVSPQIQAGEEKQNPVPNKPCCLLNYQDY